MKKGLLLLLVSMCALFANAGAPVIIVKNGGVPSEGDQTDPRSIESEVTASIEGQVLTTAHLLIPMVCSILGTI